MNPEVSILIPNYKTPDVTKLCLRLIRKYTAKDLIKVIAIDNQSEDESVEYLRKLSWIQLIERQAVEGETPSESHVGALDLAMEQVDTPYVLSIHTDTFVLNENWLPFLLSQIKQSDEIAGVGSWKLEVKSGLKLAAKRVEKTFQKIAGRGPDKHEDHFLRSHCALYRTDLIREHQLGFGMGATAGKVMHQKLVAAGYRMIFLPAFELIAYMVHLNHATMVLNEHLGAKNKTISKGKKKINQIFDQIDARSLLEDSALDE